MLNKYQIMIISAFLAVSNCDASSVEDEDNLRERDTSSPFLGDLSGEFESEDASIDAVQTNTASPTITEEKSTLEVKKVKAVKPKSRSIPIFMSEFSDGEDDTEESEEGEDTRVNSLAMSVASYGRQDAIRRLVDSGSAVKDSDVNKLATQLQSSSIAVMARSPRRDAEIVAYPTSEDELEEDQGGELYQLQDDEWSTQFEIEMEAAEDLKEKQAVLTKWIEGSRPPRSKKDNEK